jgi:hypothetical protein
MRTAWPLKRSSPVWQAAQVMSRYCSGTAGILMSGETDRQIAGIVCRCLFAAGSTRKPKRARYSGEAKSLLRERQFERLEPLVAQAFDLRALGREVVGLPLIFCPLVQVMHLLRGV